ncbi:MAG TPA: DUF3108 domain-containing protein [Acetobacteraceae bacterium]|nr:DUF3108 domain-containing protein [Acetobacteraceae bacterium]
MLYRALVPLLLLPIVAQASPVQASYDAYAAGLNVVVMDTSFDVQPDRYRVHIGYRTAGTFGVFLRAQQDTTVEGGFVGGRAAPQHFLSTGVLRGEQRLTRIDYAGGQPQIRQLVPGVEQEREPVPPEQQRNTIDTLSAMAQLMRQVNETGRCEGRVVTFDGRRLAELSARTVSEDMLPPSRLTSYSGRALHCDFDGRQLGGFKLDEDRDALQRPQHGSAWFASVVPGGPKIPVRISFRTRWFGDATMYLVDRAAR